MVFGFLRSRIKTKPEEDDTSFGNIATKLGYCNQEDIADARAKQEGRSLKERLVEHGKLSEAQADEVKALVRNRDDTQFGMEAVQRGFITDDDVGQARAHRDAKTPRMGEILVENKKLTAEQLEEILLCQKVDRGLAKADEIHQHHSRQKNKLFLRIKENLTEVDKAQARVGNMLAKKA